ncbi:MAG: hypothetical protein IKN84_05105, partial [Bacteroidales bacterium]|nr:hypothetical protein [Bacteroidales bacterium]
MAKFNERFFRTDACQKKKIHLQPVDGANINCVGACGKKYFFRRMGHDTIFLCTFASSLNRKKVFYHYGNHYHRRKFRRSVEEQRR